MAIVRFHLLSEGYKTAFNLNNIRVNMGYKDNTEPDRGVPFVRWAKSVKIRDQFECTICHERGI